jgi:cytochrome oxidase Cu insertion factor (SCO1/SenC/PrrC family)
MATEINDVAGQVTIEHNRPRWGRLLAWLGLAALLVLLFFGLLKAQKGQMKVGEKAPDFTLTSFDGQTYKLADLKGKVCW